MGADAQKSTGYRSPLRSGPQQATDGISRIGAATPEGIDAETLRTSKRNDVKSPDPNCLPGHIKNNSKITLDKVLTRVYSGFQHKER